MVISALSDIWKALREYNEQAVKIAVIFVSLYFAFAFILYTYRVIGKKERSFFRQVVYNTCLFGVFGIYLSYLISLTLSGREEGSRSGHINLDLFSTLISSSGDSFKLTGIENVLLFIPFGILVPYIWYFFRKWWNLVLIAFISSLLIEITQLETGRGYFEIDDVFLNVCGAVIGYMIFRLFYISISSLKRIYREEHRKNHPNAPYRHGPAEKREESEREKKLNRITLIIIQIIPIILMIKMIFGFSSDPGAESSKLSYFVTQKLLFIISKIPVGGIETIVEAPVPAGMDPVLIWEPVVRKIAHITEYALLSLFVYMFFYGRALGNRLSCILTFIFCFITASCDELYQRTIPERSGKFTDVLIDMVGVSVIIALICLLHKIAGLMAQKNKKGF
ncbi:MAG: VanZ family protein [Lachnospiraceae bacterium]|nr:VanZ family protein [Lachnospiraceae bacterium]